jgi:hypothetical protein
LTRRVPLMVCPSRAPEFTPGFKWHLYCLILNILCSVLWTTIIIMS